MNEAIQKLVKTWALRPPRFEPDDVEHLLYVSTQLLPDLRDAMSDIEALVSLEGFTSRKVDPPEDSPLPSNAPSPEPSPASSNRTQAVSLRMADTDAAMDQTADISGKPASLPATSVPHAGNAPSTAAWPKRKSAKKRVAVPQSEPRETV